jgi:hypothetical protein
MMRLLFRASAWTLLCLLAFATLGPLSYRPHITSDPQIERALAFLLTGAMFSAAYPRSRRATALGLLLAITGLELGQILVPGRDAHLRDAVAKAVGALVGVALSACLDRTIPRTARQP